MKNWTLHTLKKDMLAVCVAGFFGNFHKSPFVHRSGLLSINGLSWDCWANPNCPFMYLFSPISDLVIFCHLEPSGPSNS